MTAPTSEATPVVESLSRIAHVQGLRGLAVLVVVLFHAGLPLRGGFIGVDMFFVISGFVITRVLMKDIIRHGRIRFTRFYVRRFKRLLPALALMLLTVAAASSLLQSPLGSQQDSAATGIAGSIWAANLALYVVTGDYFDNASETMPLLHTWSLAVEEQFYIVFPILIMVGALIARQARRQARTGVMAVTGLIILASFALSIWLSYDHALPLVAKPSAAAFYSMPTRAWEFGIGVLVALWFANRPSGPVAQPAVARGLTAVATLALCASLALMTEVRFPGILATTPVLATGWLIVDGGREGGLASRILSWSPLQRLGDISYSWYLWHWPFITFATSLWGTGLPQITAAAISVIPAAASWRWVEEPIRHLPDQPRRRVLAIAAASSLVPMLSFMGLYAGAQKNWGQASIEDTAAQVRPVPMGYASGCHSLVPISDRDMTTCVFTGKEQGTDIWLVGDSNGGMYAEAVTGAGKELGRAVHLATASGCPLVDVEIHQGGKSPEPCSRFVAESVQALTDAAPSTIVIASANEHITNKQVALSREDGPSTFDESAKAQLWEEGVRSVIQRLTGSGHSVVVVEATPHLVSPTGEGWFSPADCSTLSLLRDPTSCDARVSLQSEDHRQRNALEAERSGTIAGGGRILSVRSGLCPSGKCSAQSGGRWVFRDGLHISVPQSKTMTPLFVKELEDR